MSKWKHKLLVIDKVDRTGLCSNCGEVKIVNKGQGKFKCIYAYHESHLNSANKNKAEISKNFLNFKDIKKPEYCEICHVKTEKLCRDHNHETKISRGWICSSCNKGIGMFYENVKLMRAAIKYIEKNR